MVEDTGSTASLTAVKAPWVVRRLLLLLLGFLLLLPLAWLLERGANEYKGCDQFWTTNCAQVASADIDSTVGFFGALIVGVVAVTRAITNHPRRPSANPGKIES